jgi:hypothetical protein
MKPRRTHLTHRVFTLPGGTEDNDLWVYDLEDDNENHIIASVWVPTDEERELIAKGDNVRLLVWGTRMFPVAMDVTNEPLGKNPNLDEVT